MRHNAGNGQLMASCMASAFQPAVKDIIHGEKCTDFDPLSCLDFSRLRKTSQCRVMQFVSMFSGAGATTLESAVCGISCKSISAIVVPTQRRDLKVFKQIFLIERLPENWTPSEKSREGIHGMESSTVTFAMKLYLDSWTAVRAGKNLVDCYLNNGFPIERYRQLAGRLNMLQSPSFYVHSQFTDILFNLRMEFNLLKTIKKESHSHNGGKALQLL